jgi:hypothetical protein
MFSDHTAVTEILKYIDNGEYHEVYDIHGKFRLTPLRIIEAIEYLKNKNVIVLNDKKIRLRTLNHISVLSEIRQLYLNNQIEIETDEESRLSGIRYLINEPYLPDFNMLDHSLLIGSKNNVIHKIDKTA